MRQILFEIPLPFVDSKLPIFGFGMALLVCFLVCGFLAARRAKEQGIDPNDFWDIGLWVFIGGLLGARTTSLLLDGEPVSSVGEFFAQFVRIWEGGMVFYGSLPGGLIAYLIVRHRIARPKGIRTLQMADIVAPMIGLGLFFGRLGCFLNGCCFGLPADPAAAEGWQQLHFPANSPPHRRLVERGHQLGYGFLLAEENLPPQFRADDPRTVMFVDPTAPAKAGGLQPGDVIVGVGQEKTDSMVELVHALRHWPLGRPLELTVRRGKEEVALRYPAPPSRAMLPTQLYSSFDGLLLYLVLTGYFPFRRREGAVFALMLILHGISRFNLEQLRSDNPEFLFGLTVSQNISLALILVGIVMMVLVQTLGRVPGPAEPVKLAAKSS